MRLWHWTQPPKPVQSEQSYDQYNAYSQLLDRNGQWIAVADTKAGVILGFLVAVFPVLIAPVLLTMPKQVEILLSRNAHTWTYVRSGSFIVLLVLFFITALITLIRVLMTLMPKLTRQRQPGLIFFGDTICKDYTQWQQSMLALDTRMLAEQVLEQIYTTASIAAYKHKYVRQAIHTLSATVILGLVLYVLSLLAT